MKLNFSQIPIFVYINEIVEIVVHHLLFNLDICYNSFLEKENEICKSSFFFIIFKNLASSILFCEIL